MPAQISTLQLFREMAERAAARKFANYSELHRWCCEQPDNFRTLLIGFTELRHSGSLQPARSNDDIMDCCYFPNVSLNYARCVLLGTSDSRPDDTAIILADESGKREQITRDQLRTMTLSAAATLQNSGIQAGDRVVAIARNSIESIVACLACTAIGATLVICITGP
jgi:acetoacetyl-CoA synthetase